MICIDDLIVTQEDLRNRSQLINMISHARNGFFDKEYLKQFPDSQLIKIIKTNDALYLHDGHHRVFSIWSSGRTFLHDSEYVIEEYSYERLGRPNPDNHWFTPYDPRIQVRLADFFEFKNNAMKLRGKELEEYITNNKQKYLRNRTASHISCLRLKNGH